MLKPLKLQNGGGENGMDFSELVNLASFKQCFLASLALFPAPNPVWCPERVDKLYDSSC